MVYLQQFFLYQTALQLHLCGTFYLQGFYIYNTTFATRLGVEIKSLLDHEGSHTNI